MSKTYYAYQKSDSDKSAKLVSFGSGSDGEQTIINLGVPTAQPQTQNQKNILRNKNFPLQNNQRIYEQCFADYVDNKARIEEYSEDNTKGYLNCDRWNTGNGAYCKNSIDEAVRMYYQFELIFDDTLTEQQKDDIVLAQLDGYATDGTKKIDESNTLTIRGKEDETDLDPTSSTFNLYYKKDNSGNRFLFTKTTNLSAFGCINDMVFGTKLYTLLSNASITEVRIKGFEDNNTCIAYKSLTSSDRWVYVPCVIKVNSDLSSRFLNNYCFSISQDDDLILHRKVVDFGQDVENQLLMDIMGYPIVSLDLTYVQCNNYNI